jgi:Tetratricopeptide repeat
MQAVKRHPAAEPLIVYAALLAPEPIPLFLFLEVREKFGEPLASALDGDGLDKAVAALRTFAVRRSPIKYQGEFAAARPLFERAVAIYEKALGPEHPNTNIVRGNIAPCGFR